MRTEAEGSIIKTKFEARDIAKVLQAKPKDAFNFFADLKQTVEKEAGHQLGNYELFKGIAEKLPIQNPHGTDERIKGLINSKDEDEKKLGKEFLFFFNAKTFVGAVDSYFDPRIDGEDDRDNMMVSAMSHLISGLNENDLNQQGEVVTKVNDYVNSGIVTFIAEKSNLPDEAIVFRKRMVSEAIDLVGASKGLDDKQIESLAQKLGNELKLKKSVNRIKSFLHDHFGINRFGFLGTERDVFDDWEVWLSASDVIYKALDRANLTPHQRNVLELKSGLRDGKDRDFNEIGIELNISYQAAQQAYNTAIAKLRKEFNYVLTLNKITL